METPPTCCCHEFWTTHHPECPTLRPSSKTPADTEVEAALRAARAKIDALCSGEERWAMSIPARRDHDPDLVISYALTLAERDLAAKDAEIERLREMAAGDEITMRRLEKERDAAENRGFRKAADWLDENRYQDSPFYADALRAEADRREGK